ncbi:MAG TPA: amino acid ABC transporter permease [Candidatus Bathyarchaeia archaeon]|nr:amino acid ABC transporter permease [Candidatus Bathyarchaeia archaeon]
MSYTWRFDVVWSYREVFLRGAAVTAELTAGALVIGLLLGLALGIAKGSRFAMCRVPAVIFIEFFRSTPALVQLVWIYYAMPIVTGLQLGSFVSVTLGLGLNAAAYFAEIFRAGIASIARGQMDAARSLGMRYPQAMRRIILPQAIRRMVPPFINEIANLVKLTTLASVLAVGELLHEAQNLITNTYRPLEVYSALAVTFAAIIFPVLLLARRLESVWRIHG